MPNPDGTPTDDEKRALAAVHPNAQGITPANSSGGGSFSVPGFVAGATANPFGTARGFTDKLGITSPAPPDLSKGPDAEKLRTFAGQLTQEYQQRQPGVAPVLDTRQSDEARGIQTGAIQSLQGVADGTTETAANALLQKGTDYAAKNAMGTAAAYSTGAPAQALRMGLTAGGDAYSKAASDAAILKAQEQANARGQLVTAAGQVRGQDITGAQSNQQSNLTQQQIDAQREANLRAAAASTLLGPLGAAQANQQIQAQNNAANQAAWGGLLSTAAPFFLPTPKKPGQP